MEHLNVTIAINCSSHGTHANNIVSNRWNSSYCPEPIHIIELLPELTRASNTNALIPCFHDSETASHYWHLQ